MNIVFTRKFLKESKSLPKNTQSKLGDLLEIMSTNPFDSRLHTKRLQPPLTGVLSFRIGRDYRALFIFESADELKIVSVKHRKDIYRI